MSVRVRMACGCEIVATGNEEGGVTCETHHERRVANVFTNPPRIVAVGCDKRRFLGPLVTHDQ